ncbi:MAG TPA: hypothetical protein VL359_18455, partial [bacterium]|nr:hypothetical protein [bacterium]
QEAAQPEAKRPRPAYRVFNSPPASPLRPALEDEEPLAPPIAPLRAAAPQPAPVAQPVPQPQPAPPQELRKPPTALEEDDVFELQNPILEPVESTPQIPSSYRPEEKRSTGRNANTDSDLDIPTFIRKRSKRFAEE